MFPTNRLCLLFCVAMLASACDRTGKAKVCTMTVTATAYNSSVAQTNGNPTLTAFGDRLEPGVKAIAVSRDLLDSGLVHGTKVQIEGLEGSYRVMDKMARRWTKKIDIYMGTDVDSARQWGRRNVKIRWEEQEEKAAKTKP